MLTLISESAAQEVLPLVTIDPGTIVFTLINTSSRFVVNSAMVAVAIAGVTDDSSLIIILLDAGTSTNTFLLFTSAVISSTHCRQYKYTYKSVYI